MLDNAGKSRKPFYISRPLYISVDMNNKRHNFKIQNSQEFLVECHHSFFGKIHYTEEF